MFFRIQIGCLSDFILSISIIVVSLLYQLRVTVDSDKSDQSIHQVSIENSSMVFDKHSEFLFIGGVPKSGTTLMRVLLDVHSQIRCGPETHIFIDMLKLRYEWKNFDHLSKRNRAAGVTSELIDEAVAAFLLEVTAKHGEPAKIPCIKEPFLMTQGGFLSTAFPNSKLIHMVRDGRAISNSLVSRNLEFPPFSATDHIKNLKTWAHLSMGMDTICNAIGKERCIRIRYEDLVEDNVKVMKEVIEWLGLDWEDAILSHEMRLDKIKISPLETTTDQVQRPVYKEALYGWRDKIPKAALDAYQLYAAALELFGYARYW